MSLESYKEQGRQAFACKEYKKAAKIYRDALVRFGDDAVLLANRAQCFIFLQDWPRALKDAENGLRCVTDPAIKIKLLFRKGVALKHSNSPEAARCFEQVLELSPSNVSAQSELDSISDLQRSKKQKVQNVRELEIEVVDELPEEFKTAAVAFSQPRDEQAVEDVARELFGHDNNTPSEPNPPPTPDFAGMPSMHYLRKLRSVPNEQKHSAFSLVLNLDNSVLASLFSASGVDVEFYDFFLDAALHSLDNGRDTVSGYIAKLELMSTFNRHSLTLTMADKSLIESFVESIEQKFPDLGPRVRKLFV